MSSVAWARLGPASLLLARLLPPLSPPVLIVSLPRSGSSWVGKTLGRSSTALYLREPVSQSHLRRHQRRGVVFAVNERSLPPGYAESARAAFAGVPGFPRNVVTFPAQWRLSARSRRRLVIKEVNPLALAWFTGRYRPRVIYLVRHPAAVAASFARLGWLSEEREPDAEQRFSSARLGVADGGLDRFADSAWAEHGALQAVAMRIALEALAGYDDHILVRYEDLCADPLGGFRRLYDFAGLAWDEEVEDAIVSETELPEHNRYETYSTFRSSRAMIDCWKSDVPPAALSELKRGFLAFDPVHYAEEW